MKLFFLILFLYVQAGLATSVHLNRVCGPRIEVGSAPLGAWAENYDCRFLIVPKSIVWPIYWNYRLIEFVLTRLNYKGDAD